MPKKGEIKIGYNGESFTYSQYGINKKTGEGSWYRMTDKDDNFITEMPIDINFDGTRAKFENDRGLNKTIDRKKRRAVSEYMQGPLAVERGEEDRERSAFNKVSILAGRKLANTVGGLKDIADKGLSMFGSDSAKERLIDRKDERDSMTDITAGLREENQFLDSISGIPQDVASGIVGSKAGTAAIGKVQNLFNRPATTGLTTQVGADTLWGAVEGAVAPDQTAGQGAVNSLLGSSIGQTPRALTKPRKNYWSPEQQKIVDWGTSSGYKLTPGMKGGSAANQNFENAVTGSQRDTTGQLASIKRHNDEVSSELAWKAAGLDVPSKTDLSPKMISDHVRSLRKEYESTAKRLKGVVERPELKALESDIIDLSIKKSPESVEAAGIMQGLFEDFKTMATFSKGPRKTGERAYRFSGEDFMELRSQVKRLNNAAYKEGGNGQLKKPLKKMLKMLEDGAARGSRRRRKGEMGDFQKFLDLNDKFATADVVRKATDENGQVDISKLRELMKGQEVGLSGNGARRKELEKILRFDSMTSNVPGKKRNYKGNRIDNPGNVGFFRSSAHDAGKFVPFMNDILMKGYMSKGRAGEGMLSGLGKTGDAHKDSSRYIRAAIMGQDPAGGLFGMGKDE